MNSVNLRFLGAAVALAAAVTLGRTSTVYAQTKPVDGGNHTSHAGHVAQPSAVPAKATLPDQVNELRLKVAQLEAALQQRQASRSNPPQQSPSSMPGMASGTGGMAMMQQRAGTMGSAGGGMGAMAPSTAGGGASPMMGDMMQEMGGMMQQMGGMMKMEMGGMSGGGSGTGMGGMAGGMQGMPLAQPMQSAGSGMSGMSGMMGMDDMMGMPPAPAMSVSALPGFPGASHLYHIGADNFFLNHDQHITLSTEQRAALNQARERALLERTTADRQVAQAEQELWQLTAADQPDATKVDAKVREIEKLRGDQRLSFIRAVGEAAKVLTDEQRKVLLGQLAPPHQTPAAAAPAGGGMGDM